MIDATSSYIPIDRRHALVAGVALPERAEGAALFADISGFTPLTEALAQELGPQRGAEELTVHLNQVYDTLIGALHRYGGSVIGFSGDAVTCWLDGDDGRRATAAALAMQAGMGQFAEIRTTSGRVVSLSVKVAVAVGRVRRFLVGDPERGMMDAMAGKTLENLVAGEHLADGGDVVLDQAAWMALGDNLEIADWRQDENTGQRFAVVTGLRLSVPDKPWPALADDILSEAQKQAWLLPPVYRRLQLGQGEFLAELRPAVALFMRFGGIDYENDETAPQKLDAFIRQVQQILARYEGSLIQLTIGDKGSYLYAAFGAPIAHEDDATRAASTALELRALAAGLIFLDDVQIGLTDGRMRTGAYGSATRRTYGVLGDAVNLSARLMIAAKPRQIIVAAEAKAATGAAFAWEQLPDLRVKGKQAPLAVWQLLGLRRRETLTLQEPKYGLPMVGRAAELALVEEKLAQVLLGRGQILGITAEAGMGKSRLTAEVISVAGKRGLIGYGGECQSYGTSSSYLVWQPIWRGFFGLDAALSVEAQIAVLTSEIEHLSPGLAQRVPLLGALLNLPIPDNALTQSLEADVRKAALETLLVECLQARARTQPLLLVLEDCHWLDDLSRELIETIGRSVVNLPVLFLLVYRPADQHGQQLPRVAHFPHFTEIKLAEFTPAEAEQLIELKLAQAIGPGTHMPPAALQRISRQAGGNPFYIEELLNYFRDRGINPQDAGQLAELALPDSIHSLILSRIDQLAENEQITMKVASVVGRMFRASMVWGIHPEDVDFSNLQLQLEMLSEMELTPVDIPDPELTYLFKHVITQQVAYESLLFSTRAVLHNQIGQHIERAYADNLDQYVELLAHHYDHSNNATKRREYLRKAGRLAQRNYANAAAIDYYERLAPLLGTDERGAVLFSIGEVLDIIGESAAADGRYREALALAVQQGDLSLQARCQIALGELLRKQGDFAGAEGWFAQARSSSEQTGDQPGLAKALICLGSLELYRGNFGGAEKLYGACLTIRRQLGDQSEIAKALNNLGIPAAAQGNFGRAETLFSESLGIRRAAGDKWTIANSLNNLGQLALDRGEPENATVYLEEALEIQREIGAKWSIKNTLISLGNARRAHGDLAGAYQFYTEGLGINQNLGDKWTFAYLFESLGTLAAGRGDATLALRLVAAGERVRQEIGSPASPIEQAALDRFLVPARQSLDEAAADAALNAGRRLSLEEGIELALSVNGYERFGG